MKLYRTYGSRDGIVSRWWDGTQLEAKSRRKAAEAQGYNNVSTCDDEVPTDKPGLLAYLNDNVSSLALFLFAVEVYDLIDDYPTITEAAKHFHTTHDAIRDALDDNMEELAQHQYLDIIVGYKSGSGYWELPLRQQKVEAYLL